MYLKTYFTKIVIHYCSFEVARIFGRHRDFSGSFNGLSLLRDFVTFSFAVIYLFLMFFFIYLLTDWKEISIRYVHIWSVLLFVFQISTQPFDEFSDYFTKSKLIVCYVYNIFMIFILRTKVHQRVCNFFWSFPFINPYHAEFHK